MSKEAGWPERWLWFNWQSEHICLSSLFLLSLLLSLLFPSGYIYKESEKAKVCPLAATERTEEKPMEQGGFLSFLRMTTGGAPAADSRGRCGRGSNQEGHQLLLCTCSVDSYRGSGLRYLWRRERYIGGSTLMDFLASLSTEQPAGSSRQMFIPQAE